MDGEADEPVGSELIKAGWAQGAIIKHEDLKQLLPSEAESTNFGIIASQSCDIAYNKIDIDPFIEISICTLIEKPKKAQLFARHPRLLDLQIQELLPDDGIISENSDIIGEISANLIACNKVSIKKTLLLDYVPDPSKRIVDPDFKGYVQWLGSRYTRPALPDDFNNQIRKAEKKNRKYNLRKIAESLAPEISGLHIEITPNRDLEPGEKYSVNLLCLVTEQNKCKVSVLAETITPLKELFELAGISIDPHIREEKKVSVATIRRFNRFYLDDISTRDDSSQPVVIH